jgi:hypothetical protein
LGGVVCLCDAGVDCCVESAGEIEPLWSALLLLAPCNEKIVVLDAS